MDTELAGVPDAASDSLRLARFEVNGEDRRPARIRSVGCVDDGFSSAELGEGVGSDSELADAPC
jgi:hypothetical protein